MLGGLRQVSSRPRVAAVPFGRSRDRGDARSALTGQSAAAVGARGDRGRWPTRSPPPASPGPSSAFVPGRRHPARRARSSPAGVTRSVERVRPRPSRDRSPRPKPAPSTPDEPPSPPLPRPRLLASPQDTSSSTASSSSSSGGGGGSGPTSLHIRISPGRTTGRPLCSLWATHPMTTSGSVSPPSSWNPCLR